ncbi:transposase [Curtobacterium sp. PhB78]|uniref:transposase n=1 Tax=Curtobacterium sp. PhB78 TaxID=2485102 RepID=UPI000F49DDB8|nr:transposase [Curtobacterium sp. PhB78]ROS35158.1 transposase [Curtobacterium sp. PhB78]
MPKPYPKEFRDDVVRVAENREPGVSIKRIVGDFGVHPMTLTKWLARSGTEKTAVDTGAPLLGGRDAEIRELRKRNRLLEQEFEVRRRICRKRTFRESARTSRDMNINRLTPPCLRSAS